MAWLKYVLVFQSPKFNPQILQLPVTPVSGALMMLSFNGTHTHPHIPIQRQIHIHIHLNLK